MRYEFYTSYCEGIDITVIFRDTIAHGELSQTTIWAFYHGEPDPQQTEYYIHNERNITAHYEGIRAN